MITRTLAIASEKGGVGKSTLSTNLGAALGEMGRKVLVVDVDAQAATTCAWRITNYAAIGELE